MALNHQQSTNQLPASIFCRSEVVDLLKVELLVTELLLHLGEDLTAHVPFQHALLVALLYQFYLQRFDDVHQQGLKGDSDARRQPKELGTPI